MCSPFKAIKKIFRKVAKHAKIIVPVVLGAAAIYFTAGAALGGGAGISGLVGQLGLGSTLSSVLSGAVTQAGIGAAIGAGTSLVTGGDVGKGALLGGAAGAVTGGITGAVNAPSSGVTGVAATPPSSAAAPGAPVNLVPSQGPVGAPLVTAAGPAADAASSDGLLSGVGKFITDNQTLLGGAVQGIGAGLGGLAEADAAVEAAQIAADRQAELEATENARVASNFDVSGGGGLLSGSTTDATPRPTPAQQFTVPSVQARSRGARWRYNPETGQVELTTG